jgi:uncharacterized membrane protein (GlpM family)
VAEALVLVAKGLAGGSLVVLFALLGEAVHPKSFSGVFAGAPSIALAGLLLTVAAKGAGDARTQAAAMAVTAVALVGYCIASIILVDRHGALLGSALAFGSWIALAAAVYVLVLA